MADTNITITLSPSKCVSEFKS